jgi:replicative DNA helicase
MTDANFVYGKIPPQDVKVERAILGVVIMLPSTVDDFLLFCKPEYFYLDAHAKVARAIFSVASKGKQFDLYVLQDELKKTDDLEAIGGSYFLVQLTNEVVSDTRLRDWCKIVEEKWILREAINFGGKIVQDAYDGNADAEKILEYIETGGMKIGNEVSDNEMKPMQSVLMDAFRKISEWQKLDSTVTGVPSGIEKLDFVTRGWQPGDLVVVAARPSVGKTALSLSFALAASKHYQSHKMNKKIAIFSLEMDAVYLVLRMLSSESQTILSRILTGRLDDNQMHMLYQDGVQRLSELGILFDDKPSLTMRSFKAKSRRIAKKQGLGLIILDYLQLAKAPDAKTREQEIAKISSECKSLARELNVPVIALSQLSREIEKRKGKAKAPQLSDLRESGAIEQDADVVLMLWAPEEEDIEKDKELETVRYIRVAKQRNGVVSTIKAEFRTDIQRFSDHKEEKALSGWKPSGNLVDFTEPLKK